MKRLIVLTTLFAAFGFTQGARAQVNGTQHSVEITWTAPSPVGGSGSVQGYNIYRLLIPTTMYSKINAALITETTYMDTSVTPGATYDYEVTTVDTGNSESVGSTAAEVNVPSNYMSPDFTGTFDHNASSANPGAQASYVLTLTPLGGFTGDVALNASGLPAGVRARFSPAVVTGGSGPSTITVTTLVTTPVGNYPITITGSSGMLVHSTTITLLVGTVDFTGSITPVSRSASVSAGGSAQYTLSISTVGTQPFGNSVALSISGLPQGVMASFSPASVNPDANGSSVLTLTVSATTPQGSYTPLVTATGGGVTHAGNITLTVPR